MKILVTGASGFVGSHLVPYLLEAGHSIVAAGRDQKRLERTFPEKDRKLTLVATSYDGDLVDLFNDNKINAIVHLAAKLPSRATPDQLDAYIVANVLLLERILNASLRYGVKNVVYLSSQSVYSSFNKLPFSESEPARPDNFYGLSKLMGEELAGMYNRVHDMQIKSLRAAQLIGKGEREGYMLSMFIEKARRGEPLSVWGDGKGARDYLSIDDLNSAILSALLYEVTGVFNIGSGRPVTHLELAKTISRVFKNEAQIIMEKNKKEDKSVRFMEVASAKELLSWVPVFELKNALLALKKYL